MKLKLYVFIISLIMLLLAPAFALKVKAFTLKELIETADTIVVAQIVVDNEELLAKIQRIIKGNCESIVKIETTSFRPSDAVTLVAGSEVILFFEPVVTTGQRKLLGYSDQGIWPKQEEKWPYTSAYISSLEQAEGLITSFIRLKEENMERDVLIRELLLSENVFYESVALEYLESPEYDHLHQQLQLEIERLTNSPSLPLRRKALSLQK